MSLRMGLAGLEPATSPLSGVRSSQLSYKPARRRMGGRDGEYIRRAAAGELWGEIWEARDRLIGTSREGLPATDA